MDCAAPAGGAARANGNRPVTFRRASEIKRQHSARLFAIPDVVGHGIGASPTGEPVIEIYLAKENAAARAQLQAALDNVPVRVVVTGRFEAF